MAGEQSVFGYERSCDDRPQIESFALTVAERDFEVTTVPDLLTFNIMVATLVYGRTQQPLASGCPTQILLRTLA